MYTLVAERPILLSLILLALAAAVAFVWVQVGKPFLMYLAGLILLLVPIGIYASIVLETDRESLTRTIREVAAAVESEDYERVYSFIDPQAKEALRLAQMELPSYEFTSARVTAFREFDIRNDLDPTQAIVELVANVIVSSRTANFGQARVVRVVIIKFRKTGDQWKAVEYTHHKFPKGPDSHSPNGGKRPTF